MVIKTKDTSCKFVDGFGQVGQLILNLKSAIKINEESTRWRDKHI